MVYSEIELARLFGQKLAVELDGQLIEAEYGVPEEEVYKEEKPMPYMSLFYLWHETSEQDRLMGHYYKQTGTGDETTYHRMEMPEPVIFYYQLDIYSQDQKNLLQLSTALWKVIKQRGSYLVDTDGDAISITRTDVQDFSRDSFRLEKSEERMFRRSYTFALRGYFQPQDNPDTTFGPVLSTDIIFKDKSDYKTDYP